MCSVNHLEKIHDVGPEVGQKGEPEVGGGRGQNLGPLDPCLPKIQGWKVSAKPHLQFNIYMDFFDKLFSTKKSTFDINISRLKSMYKGIFKTNPMTHPICPLATFTFYGKYNRFNINLTVHKISNLKY